MKHKMRRVLSLLLAGVIAAGCIPLTTAEAVKADAQAVVPGDPIEARSFAPELSRTEGGVGTTENAVDFTSYGGTFAAGDYLCYPDLDFSADAYEKLMLVLSADQANAGKEIEIRLDAPDGQELGSLSLTDTNGSQTFKEHYADLTAADGVHDLYLVFPEETAVDLDFFILTAYHFEVYQGDDPNDKEAYDYLLEQTWETGEDRDARMEWFRDAGYGMFIHFGAYSELGGRTLDPNPTYDAPYTPKYRQTSEAEWIMKRPNKIPKEIYREYAAAEFNPSEFDADEIVKLAQEAGQKYLVITTRHHDGFSMYDTQVREHRDYKITGVANHGSFGRDPVRELADACKATYGTDQEVRFCAYITLPDWYDSTQYPSYGEGVGGGHDGSHVNTFQGADEAEKNANRDEYLSRLKGQLRELLVDYDADMIWFDNANMIKLTHEQSYSIYNYIRALKPEALVNNRVFTYRSSSSQTTAVMDLDFKTVEQSTLKDKPGVDFESCMTLNEKWGYHNTNNNWKSPEQVIDLLLQCVGLGGNLLLNIGPDGDGNVPERSQEILREVGRWLKPVGDSIYGTRSAFYEVSDLPEGVYATAKDGRLFFHVMADCSETALLVDAPANAIKSAQILNTGKAIDVVEASGRLFIDLSGVVRDRYDTVIAIDVEGYPEAAETGGEEEPVNLAKAEFDAGRMTVEGSPAFISSSGGDYRLENIFSGATGDNSVGDYYGAADSVNDGMYAELTFTNEVTVNQAVLYVRQASNKNQKIYNVEIQWWNPALQDGQGDWETVGLDESGEPRPDRQRVEINLEKTVTTKKIRLWLPGADKPSIREFELYNNPNLGGEQFAITAPAGKVPAGSFTISGTCPATAETVQVKLSGEGIAAATLEAEISGSVWNLEVDTARWPVCVENLTVLALMTEGGETAGLDYRQITYGQWENLALGKGVAVSSRYSESYAGSKMTNGITDTTTDRWASLADDAAPWFIVDLGETETVNRVVLYEWKDGSAYRAGKYRIECSPSETGDDWAVVYEGDEIGARGVAAFAPAEARRVRVTLLEYATEGKQPSIHEVEIYADMPVYKDALTTAIQQAVAAYGRLGEDLSAQGYNSETAAVYLDALARAEAAEGSENADQAEINGALAALKSAIAGLSKEPVKPEQSVEGVTLDQQAAALEVGETLQLTATVKPEDAANKAVRWSSSREEVATVSDTGLVTAVGEGEAVITVMTADGGKTAACTVTVADKGGSSGSGSSVVRYTISVIQSAGGSISPSTTSVARGSGKSFTITPDEGYVIADVRVDGRSVGAVSSYTFENVSAKHTITAEFTRSGAAVQPAAGFTDVRDGDWFAEAVQYAVDKELMNGTSETAFTPNGDTTRGMVVTILYRLAGSPEVESDGAAWWSDARVWAMETGVSDGTNMEGKITREQLAAMLYRYAGSPEAAGDLGAYADAEQVSGYAAAALGWAEANGIVTGKPGHLLDPQAGASRAETAAMLMRLDMLPDR